MWLQGEHSQAVKALQEYIQLCLHQEHVPAEAQAFCALADCQQFLGNLEGAMQSLQAFLLKSRHHDAQVSSYSCLALCRPGVHPAQECLSSILMRFACVC